MAYDEDPAAAKFPWEAIPNSAIMRSQFTPVGFDLEPELKFSINLPRKVLVQSAATSSKPSTYIQNAFLALAKTFQRPAPHEYSFIARDGMSPRNYILTNLGQDTGRKFGNWVLPELEIHRNGYQYRERFAIPVFAGLPYNEIICTNYDANAKTLLSEGQHRKEFETKNDPEINPTNSFNKFRQQPNVPEFFQHISPDDLYVIKTWLTSRSTFFSLSQIPGTGLLALCEHCCDVTRYSTGNFDHFINGGKDDPEWETEVKGFYGHDPRLHSEDGQVELIDIIFADIYRRFKDVTPDISLNELSKMERARILTEAFHAPSSNYRDYTMTNNPIAQHLSNVGATVGLSHAFLQAITARKAVDAAHLPRIVSLAAHMINPFDLVDAQALQRHICDNPPGLNAA